MPVGCATGRGAPVPDGPRRLREDASRAHRGRPDCDGTKRANGRAAGAGARCWNRALSLDPKNEEILRALRQIEGRRRIY